MVTSLDREKLNHCLLTLISSLHVLENLGDLDSQAAKDYASELRGFVDYTMETLARMPERAPLRVVD